MKDGIYDMSNEAYHNDNAYSRSDLMRLKKSPFHFLNHVTTEPSPEMLLGTLVHTLVLEPQTFDDEYYVEVKVDRRTKEGKELAKLMEEESKGKVMVKPDILAKAKSMAENVLESDIGAAIKGAQIEKSFFWTDNVTGLQFKCRPDALLPNMIIDLKTTKDASLRAMQSSAMNLGYFIQLGMCNLILKHFDYDIHSTIIVAVENAPPYAARLMPLDKEAIDYGIRAFRILAGRLKECLEVDKWPSYNTDYLTLPNWAEYEEF